MLIGFEKKIVVHIMLYQFSTISMWKVFKIFIHDAKKKPEKERMDFNPEAVRSLPLIKASLRIFLNIEGEKRQNVASSRMLYEKKIQGSTVEETCKWLSNAVLWKKVNKRKPTSDRTCTSKTSFHVYMYLTHSKHVS